MNISVALCTYNGSTYLNEQLDSIAKQLHQPTELVVCDDGSTDITLDLLQNFADRVSFPVRIYVNPMRLGVSKNFERAISLCTGEYIALCDQDDVWMPDKLVRLKNILKKSPNVGAAFSDAELVEASGRPLGRRLWQSVRFTPHEQAAVNEGQELPILLKHRVVTGATLMFRASFCERVLPISSLWLHDSWIAFIIALFAELRALPKPLIAYRQHAQNQVGTATSYTASVQEAANRGRASYSHNYQQYRELRERIELWGDVPDKAAILTALDAKMAHIAARANLPDNPLLRFVPVIRELALGRYHRYSSGWQSAAKDILILG